MLLSDDVLYSQDIDSLERQISDDLNQGKTPLFIMAYAGTTHPPTRSLTPPTLQVLLWPAILMISHH